MISNNQNLISLNRIKIAYKEYETKTTINKHKKQRGSTTNQPKKAYGLTVKETKILMHYNTFRGFF